MKNLTLVIFEKLGNSRVSGGMSDSHIVFLSFCESLAICFNVCESSKSMLTQPGVFSLPGMEILRHSSAGSMTPRLSPLVYEVSEYV